MGGFKRSNCRVLRHITRLCTVSSFTGVQRPIFVAVATLLSSIVFSSSGLPRTAQLTSRITVPRPAGSLGFVPVSYQAVRFHPGSTSDLRSGFVGLSSVWTGGFRTGFSTQEVPD